MKNILSLLPIGIGMLLFGSVFSQNGSSVNQTSSNIKIVENKETSKSRLKIYYIRHAEGGHNVKREWGIYPTSEWPSYVGNHKVFTPKGIMQQSRVAKKLKRFNFDFVAVSSAIRCKNTVLPYLIDSNIKGEIWPELQEIYATSLNCFSRFTRVHIW